MAERPAENWFLGRGSKSRQNEMLAVFRWQTREVVLEYRVVPSRWRFSGWFGLKRTDSATVYMRHITLSRDFHGLTICRGTFNRHNSSENIADLFNSINIILKRILAQSHKNLYNIINIYNIYVIIVFFISL